MSRSCVILVYQSVIHPVKSKCHASDELPRQKLDLLMITDGEADWEWQFKSIGKVLMKFYEPVLRTV